MFKELSTSLAGACILLFAAAVSPGQVTPPTPPAQPPTAATPVATPIPGCPKLEVKTATQPVREGMPVKFTGAITGGDSKVMPMYDWSVSSGVIRSGQGTNTIEVDTTGAGADKAIYATILVGGYPPDCVMTAGATAIIAGPAQKMDEYGVISTEEQEARLDAFISKLTSADNAYIIAYGGKTSPRGTAYSNLRAIRAHILKRGAPSDRVYTVDGGFREQPSHELWVVPIGAEPPRPTPTVDAKDVTPPKPVPTPRKRP
jgi:hypothetical protein